MKKSYKIGILSLILVGAFSIGYILGSPSSENKNEDKEINAFELLDRIHEN